MNLDQIKTYLASSDSQERMKAVTELGNYDSDIAVPLLIETKDDREFLVRSFVAMGLRKKQNADSFAALLEMMKFDRDPNVRAEAANSLSFFGKVAAPHLALMFDRDDHWLVRRSILAALVELDCPEELLEVCIVGIEGEDQSVKESSINCLRMFAGTPKQDLALEKLLSLIDDDWWRTRMQVAKSLGKFALPQAKQALEQLKEDEDHRVVGAVLESLV